MEADEELISRIAEEEVNKVMINKELLRQKESAMDVEISVRQEGSDGWMWGMWDHEQELFSCEQEQESSAKAVVDSLAVIGHISGTNYPISEDDDGVGVWRIFRHHGWGHNGRLVVKLNDDSYIRYLFTYFADTEQIIRDRIASFNGQEFNIKRIRIE